MRHTTHRLSPAPARSLRSAGTSGVLAVWILLLSFAGVSPTLHGWLHGEIDCASRCAQAHDNPLLPQEAPQEHEGHFCGVTFLQSGALALVPFQVPTDSSVVRSAPFIYEENPSSTTASIRFQARAPPIEIVV